MKSVFFRFLPAILLASCSSDRPVDIPATSDSILYMGRTVTTPEGNVAFNYPGVTAMLNFEGKSLELLTSPGSGSWVAEIDTLAPIRREIGEGDSTLLVADYLSDGPHTARITYCIEGYEKHPQIRGFRLAPGAKILPAPERPALKIEFIGNSITCGYGAEADSATVHFSYDTENHCLTYAHLTGRALEADVNVVARSGIGMYRNYNGPREGNDKETMPLEYDNAMLYDHNTPWDFSRFTPDIVCINLGTNDTSTQNYDISLYEKAYGSFLDRLRSHYPEAKIVLLTGPMLGGRELTDVKDALDRLASDRAEVYRFDMTPEDGSLGYGADYHPSAARHRVMAEELTAFLRDSIAHSPAMK